MATTIRTPVGALYVDNNRVDNLGVGIDYINNVPEDTETRVKVSASIKLWIVSFGANDVANVLINVTRDGNTALAYDQAGTGFQTGWSGVATLQSSPSSGNNDELILELIPDTVFTSLDVITVRVQGDAGIDSIDTSYTFTIQDIDPPTVDEILWREPRQARLRFTKTMKQDDEYGGTLFIKSISGAMEFVAPNSVRIKNFVPTSDLIGYWIGVTGSAYPGNNGYFKIDSVSSTNKTLTFDMTGLAPIKNDDGVDKDSSGIVVRSRNLRGFISSYRFEARPQDEVGIECAYEPIVLSVRAPLLEEIPQDADITRYVIINLHDDISINRLYKLHLGMAEDFIRNAADVTSIFDFTSPSFGYPSKRVNLWDLIPVPTQDEDLLHGGELRKLTCVLQDVLNVLWHRADSFENLNDPYTAPSKWVDYLLYSLGNPFRFPLTPLGKRRLISVLIPIYKRMGTEKIIEDVIAFFLGIAMDVRPFISGDYWEIGSGLLGVSTILGPGSAYARNSYEIVTPVVLTSEQERIVREIATTLHPFYMHLVRISGPS